MIKVHKAAEGTFRQQIDADGVQFFSDLSVASGGDGAGPDGHGLLDAALGACTALTITMVARRKQLALEDVRVQITHHDDGGVYRMQRQIELVGDLSAEQRDYLLGIANKCPVHKLLTGAMAIETHLKA